MLITMPIQLEIGQNYHQKKWRFKSFQQYVDQSSLINIWVQIAWKHIVHLGLGFGEKLLRKNNLKLMNVLIKFWDRVPCSLGSHVLTTLFIEF